MLIITPPPPAMTCGWVTTDCNVCCYRDAVTDQRCYHTHECLSAPPASRQCRLSVASAGQTWLVCWTLAPEGCWEWDNGIRISCWWVLFSLPIPSVYKMSGWKGGLEPGKLKLNLMTLGFQGSSKKRGVEISHLLSSYLWSPSRTIISVSEYEKQLKRILQLS